MITNARGTSMAVMQFQVRSMEIVKSCGDADDKGASSPYASRWGTFKREAYTLIRQTISREGGHKIIKYAASLSDYEPVRFNYLGNEFYYGLCAIDPGRCVLVPRQLSVFARQMKYANLHDVEEKHLIGFLYQSGSAAKIKHKLLQNEREPWLSR